LDDLLTIPDINNFNKVIIKMDVEGYESHVLNGAERFFRKVDVQGVLKLIDNGSTAITFLPSLATARENTPKLAPRSINCSPGSFLRSVYMRLTR
jgi:hypothetical protein